MSAIEIDKTPSSSEQHTSNKSPIANRFLAKVKVPAKSGPILPGSGGGNGGTKSFGGKKLFGKYALFFKSQQQSQQAESKIDSGAPSSSGTRSNSGSKSSIPSATTPSSVSPISRRPPDGPPPKAKAPLASPKSAPPPTPSTTSTASTTSAVMNRWHSNVSPKIKGENHLKMMGKARPDVTAQTAKGAKGDDDKKQASNESSQTKSEVKSDSTATSPSVEKPLPVIDHKAMMAATFQMLQQRNTERHDNLDDNKDSSLAKEAAAVEERSPALPSSPSANTHTESSSNTLNNVGSFSATSNKPVVADVPSSNSSLNQLSKANQQKPEGSTTSTLSSSSNNGSTESRLERNGAAAAIRASLLSGELRRNGEKTTINKPPGSNSVNGVVGTPRSDNSPKSLRGSSINETSPEMTNQQQSNSPDAASSEMNTNTNSPLSSKSPVSLMDENVDPDNATTATVSFTKSTVSQPTIELTTPPKVPLFSASALPTESSRNGQQQGTPRLTATPLNSARSSATSRSNPVVVPITPREPGDDEQEGDTVMNDLGEHNSKKNSIENHKNENSSSPDFGSKRFEMNRSDSVGQSEHGEDPTSEEQRPTLCTTPVVLMSRNRENGEVCIVSSPSLSQQGTLSSCALLMSELSASNMIKKDRSSETELKKADASPSSSQGNETVVFTRTESRKEQKTQMVSGSIGRAKVPRSQLKKTASKLSSSKSFGSSSSIPQSSSKHSSTFQLASQVTTSDATVKSPRSIQDAREVGHFNGSSAMVIGELSKTNNSTTDHQGGRSHLSSVYSIASNDSNNSALHGVSSTSVAMRGSSLVQQQVNQLLRQTTHGFEPSVHSQSSMSSLDAREQIDKNLIAHHNNETDLSFMGRIGGVTKDQHAIRHESSLSSLSASSSSLDSAKPEVVLMNDQSRQRDIDNHDIAYHDDSVLLHHLQQSVEFSTEPSGSLEFLREKEGLEEGGGDRSLSSSHGDRLGKEPMSARKSHHRDDDGMIVSPRSGQTSQSDTLTQKSRLTNQESFPSLRAQTEVTSQSAFDKNQHSHGGRSEEIDRLSSSSAFVSSSFVPPKKQSSVIVGTRDPEVISAATRLIEKMVSDGSGLSKALENSSLDGKMVVEVRLKRKGRGSDGNTKDGDEGRIKSTASHMRRDNQKSMETVWIDIVSGVCRQANKSNESFDDVKYHNTNERQQDGISNTDQMQVDQSKTSSVPPSATFNIVQRSHRGIHSASSSSSSTAVIYEPTILINSLSKPTDLTSLQSDSATRQHHSLISPSAFIRSSPRSPTTPFFNTLNDVTADGHQRLDTTTTSSHHPQRYIQPSAPIKSGHSNSATQIYSFEIEHELTRKTTHLDAEEIAQFERQIKLPDDQEPVTTSRGVLGDPSLTRIVEETSANDFSPTNGLQISPYSQAATSPNDLHQIPPTNSSPTTPYDVTTRSRPQLNLTILSPASELQPNTPLKVATRSAPRAVSKRRRGRSLNSKVSMKQPHPTGSRTAREFRRHPRRGVQRATRQQRSSSRDSSVTSLSSFSTSPRHRNRSSSTSSTMSSLSVTSGEQYQRHHRHHRGGRPAQQTKRPHSIIIEERVIYHHADDDSIQNTTRSVRSRGIRRHIDPHRASPSKQRPRSPSFGALPKKSDGPQFREGRQLTSRQITNRRSRRASRRRSESLSPNKPRQRSIIHHHVGGSMTHRERTSRHRRDIDDAIPRFGDHGLDQVVVRKLERGKREEKRRNDDAPTTDARTLDSAPRFCPCC